MSPDDRKQPEDDVVNLNAEGFDVGETDPLSEEALEDAAGGCNQLSVNCGTFECPNLT